MQIFKFLVEGFTSPGSFFMWLILFLAFVLLGVVIERVWFLFLRCGTGSGSFMSGISRYLKAGDYEKAIAFSQKESTPLAKGVTSVLKNRGQSTKKVQKAVDEVFLTESPKITRNIQIINVMANLATLLGLTGTIFGLMMAFDAIANVPAAQRAQALATGISVAMATTLFGLMVAMPGIICQGLLSQKSDKVIEEMDEKTAKLVNLIEEY